MANQKSNLNPKRKKKINKYEEQKAKKKKNMLNSNKQTRNKAKIIHFQTRPLTRRHHRHYLSWQMCGLHSLLGQLLRWHHCWKQWWFPDGCCLLYCDHLSQQKHLLYSCPFYKVYDGRISLSPHSCFLSS
ncbi:hypothetical protein P3X46_028942 [Hevea brasiliensis]|uniref:Reverse transcriptase zinc-binding domain-containing protein n=1 Tax=Hevea brasiliensis TaxID=3981 RepID=A0ABQ9KQQ4_HEVBR|nr:hypothetical protein P3X46_028942 [Hevea brasiliensis]